jgi:hypothetical protein
VAILTDLGHQNNFGCCPGFDPDQVKAPAWGQELTLGEGPVLAQSGRSLNEPHMCRQDWTSNFHPNGTMYPQSRTGLQLCMNQ